MRLATVAETNSKMNQSLKLIAILILLTSLTGCQSPVKDGIHIVVGDLSAKPSAKNETKVVIFNDSSFVLFGMDESREINVKMNGRSITKLGPGRYAQVIVPNGIFQVDLVHWDIKRFSSKQRIEFNGSESFLQIHATTTANEAQLVPQLPPDFERKFQPVK